MTGEHKRTTGVGVVLCPACGEIHIMVVDEENVCTSIPLTRAEWAKLLGAYGDLLEKVNREGKG